MNPFRLLAIVTCLFAAPTLAACASDVEEQNVEEGTDDIVQSAKVDERTRSFSGTYSVDDATTPLIWFEVTNIDWNARTAVYSMTALDTPWGKTVMANHLPAQIQLARCPGCYTFSLQYGPADSQATIASLRFSNGAFTGVTHNSGEARDLKLTSINGSGGAAATGSSVSGGGACSLICGSEVFDCKPAASQAACNQQLFGAVPRCPHTFEFKAGRQCN